MRVIPVGYGNAQHRELIPQLMQDANTIIVDIKYSQAASLYVWSGRALAKKYGDRYVWIKKLGNKHYKTPELGISIVDLEDGLIDLHPILQDVDTALLLCGCGNYGPTEKRPHGCHRKAVVDAIIERWSDVEVVLPETLLSRRCEEEPTAQAALSGYWSLSLSEQIAIREQAGRR